MTESTSTTVRKKVQPKRGGRRRFFAARWCAALGVACVCALTIGTLAGGVLVRSGDAATIRSGIELADLSARRPAALRRLERLEAQAKAEVTGAVALDLGAPASPPHALARPPRIAVIVDDIGVDRARSHAAIALPGPLTIAVLSYADNLDPVLDDIAQRGHQLIVHLPMEPKNGGDAGPHALRTRYDEARIERELDWALTRIPGAVGVNNHMGSRFTSDAAAMQVVLRTLKSRNLYFVDSRTTAESRAYRVAQSLGVRSASRDVFLDSELGVEVAHDIRERLKLVERVARQNGEAIAIAHPYDETLDVLGPWLVTAPMRGFELVWASEIARVNAQEPLDIAARRGDAPS